MLNFKRANVSTEIVDDRTIEFIRCFLEAEKAVESLRGRYFAGRLIKPELYDQTAYLAEDFSG